MDSLLRSFPDKIRDLIEGKSYTTDVNDLVSYIYSLRGMTSLSVIPGDTIRKCLSLHMKDGVLTIPKEYGMFIAKE